MIFRISLNLAVAMLVMMSPIDIPPTIRLYISTVSLYSHPERLIGF
jgi:hypothetical protein